MQHKKQSVYHPTPQMTRTVWIALFRTHHLDSLFPFVWLRSTFKNNIQTRLTSGYSRQQSDDDGSRGQQQEKHERASTCCKSSPCMLPPWPCGPPAPTKSSVRPWSNMLYEKSGSGCIFFPFRCGSEIVIASRQSKGRKRGGVTEDVGVVYMYKCAVDKT